MSSPPAVVAITSGRRFGYRSSQITAATVTSSSGQPRKVLYSAGPVVSRAASVAAGDRQR